MLKVLYETTDVHKECIKGNVSNITMCVEEQTSANQISNSHVLCKELPGFLGNKINVRM